MAYKRKYYKYLNCNGHLWSLHIYQNTDEEVAAREIGPVLQSLRLVMQGDQADVDTPIVKTSLEMTFVDASDMDGKKKTGFWEEFYTSSATEWKVELMNDTEKRAEWTGYITPDSFSEDLRYRGSVSIIARDNLGTMQDTTCDCTDLQNKDGKVFIWDIIDKAFQVSTCAMQLSYDLGAFPFAADNQSEPMWENGGNALWHLVDAAHLSEYNWWEALEKVLYSIGACMRYIGQNKVIIVPMRDLPKGGFKDWWEIPVMPTRFLAFGHRELVPGVKSITETNEWNAEAEAEPEKIAKYTGTSTLACNNINLTAINGVNIGPDFNVPAWGYSNFKTGEAVSSANSALLNVNNYARLRGEDSEAYGAWDDSTIVYMALNSRVDKPLEFTQYIHSDSGKITVSFFVDKPVTLTSDYSRVLNLPIAGTSNAGLGKIAVRIKFVSSTDASVLYYDDMLKRWHSSSVENSVNLNESLFRKDKPEATKVEFKDLEIPAVGALTLEIVRISNTVFNTSVRVPCVGVYMRLREISISVTLPEDLSLLKKLTLTTNYSDRYAVRLTRDPEFSVNPSSLPEVAYIPNALLNEGAYQYRGLSDWIWLHGRKVEGPTAVLPEHTGVSLSRLIHQQLLAYHATPNNLLTGELVDVDLANPFTALYEWGGVKHMLLSGALNILTGRMESAVLRSYERYDRMWETYIEEGDVIEVPYNDSNTFLRFVAVSEKQLTGDDITLPEGVTNYGFTKDGNKYRWAVWVEPNETNRVIEQVMTVDTARVLLRRLPKLEKLIAADGELYDKFNEQIYVTQ